MADSRDETATYFIQALPAELQPYAKDWWSYIRGQASLPADRAVYGLSDRQAQQIRLKLAQIV